MIINITDGVLAEGEKARPRPEGGTTIFFNDERDKLATLAG